MVEITKVKYNIPYFGNKHSLPYGVLEIRDEQGNLYKRFFDLCKENKYIINNNKFILRNTGAGLYTPKFILERIL